MSSTTVRISHKTWHTLKELAAQAGEPMHTIIDHAIEDYRRRRFLDDANRAYAALRSNPAAWKAEIEERAAWDSATHDPISER